MSPSRFVGMGRASLLEILGSESGLPGVGAAFPGRHGCRETFGEGETMKTIALEDRELRHNDYSDFELELQRRGVVLEAAVDTFTTPEGVTHSRLAHPVVTFSETDTDAAGLQKLLQVYGFKAKSS
jgi:hypothetical protein